MEIFREGPLAVAILLAPPVGIGIGLWAVYRLIRGLERSPVARRLGPSNSLRATRLGALICGLLSLPIAIGLAFFVGAYFGGGFGSLLGKGGTIVGMALGAGVLVVMVAGFAAVTGSFLGGWLRQILARH